MPMDKQDLKVKQLCAVATHATFLRLTDGSNVPIIALALTEDGQILPVIQNRDGVPILSLGC